MCVICVIHDGRKGWFGRLVTSSVINTQMRVFRGLGVLPIYDAVQLSHVYSKIMLGLNSVGTIVLNMSRFYIVFFF